MPVLNGPALDKLSKELEKWYTTNREKLILALSEGYPYGAVRLSPVEQVTNFLEMQPEDWQMLIMQLQNRYRGDSRTHEKVESDIQGYVAHMLTLIAGGE